MKFTQLNSFKNLKDECSFIINNNELFINAETNLIKYNLITNNQSIIIKSNVYWFIPFNKDIIYQEENGKSLFSYQGKKNKGIFYLSRSFIFDNKILVRGKNSETKKREVVLLYDDLSIKPLNLTHFPDKIIDNNTYAYIALNTLFVYTFNNELLWQHSFSDLLKAEDVEQVGDIIIDKKILYLCLKDNLQKSNFATFAIKTKTGEILNIYPNFGGSYLKLHGNFLFRAKEYSLLRLNTKTKEITTYNFENILKPHNLQIQTHRWIIKENLLFFVDGDFFPTNKVGIINLETQKLIWKKHFEINDEINKNIQEIRVVENRLYVHCSDNTLHIFEKENS